MRKHGLDSHVIRKSGADILTLSELLAKLPRGLFQHGTLPSELHADPEDDINDISGGKFLEAIDQLSFSARTLLESEGIHITITEFLDHQIISKIVMRRDAEFAIGKEKFFAVSTDGRRVPMTEEEWDKYTGGDINQEDIYNQTDIEFVRLEGEYSAPMDKWDLVFDATRYIQHVKNLNKQLEKLEDAELEILDTKDASKSRNDIICTRAAYFVNKDPNIPPDTLLRKVKFSINGLIKSTKFKIKAAPKLVDSLVYSSNWFPYKQDKSLLTKKAREIIQTIKDSNLSKKGVGEMIDNSFDNRSMIAQQLRKRAAKMKPGKHKARMLIKAQSMLQSRSNDMITRKITDDGKQVLVTINQQPSQIPQSNITRIWEAWHRRRIELNGENQLTSWQFRRHLNKKYMPQLSERLKEQLDKEEISKEEARAQKELGYELIIQKVKAVYHEA